MEKDYSVWKSTVRDYEIDYQRIVGNAVYFQYFDQARAEYWRYLGVNVCEYAVENKHIVLVKTAITYKKSLVYGDAFAIHSLLHRISRFKFLFEQKVILDADQQLMTASESVLACVGIDGKPCVLDQLQTMPIVAR